MHDPMRTIGRLTVLLAIATQAGCQAGPIAPPRASFVLGLDEAPAAATPVAERMVRLQGFATVPTRMRDLANVQEGRVSGSPVVVRDVATGRALAKAVTYYDGSFLIDVPLTTSQQAVVVTIDLIDRADPRRTVALQTPVMLRKGIDRIDVALSTGTTALTAFLSQLAAVQAGSSAAPAGVQAELGNLIAVYEPEAQTQFARLAESAPEIREASSVSGLETGVQRYVGRLTTGKGAPRKLAAEPREGETNGL